MNARCAEQLRHIHLQSAVFAALQRQGTMPQDTAIFPFVQQHGIVRVQAQRDAAANLFRSGCRHQDGAILFLPIGDKVEVSLRIQKPEQAIGDHHQASFFKKYMMGQKGRGAGPRPFHGLLYR